MKRTLACLLLLLFCACAPQGASQSLNVTALPLDGADCVLLSFDGHAVMIDAGRDADAETVTDALDAQGIAALDALIVTQYLPEHAGGAAALLLSVPVKALYLPAYEPDSPIFRAVRQAAGSAGCEVVTVTEDRTLSFGAAGFSLWASPVPYDGENDSEQSLAAAVTYGDHRLVFLSCADGAWLDALCYGNYNLTCDVLKMPRHGAWVQHDFELIAFSFARHAILTDGTSMPADAKTVSGLKLIGCKVWQTKDGAVRLHSDGREITEG